MFTSKLWHRMINITIRLLVTSSVLLGFDSGTDARSYDSGERIGGMGIESMLLDSGFLYLGSAKGLVILRQEDLPASSGTVDPIATIELDQMPVSMSLIGTDLHLLLPDFGIVIVDVASPANAAVKRAVELPLTGATSMDYSGDFAIVGFREGLWSIVNTVESHDEPAIFETSVNNVEKILVGPEHLYISGLMLIEAFDISDLAHPISRHVLEMDGSTVDMVLFGTQLIVSAGQKGLRIIDTTALGSEDSIATIDDEINTWIYSTVLDGDMAYAADGNGYLWVIRLRDGVDPKLEYQLGVKALGRHLVARDNIVITPSTWGDGLHIIHAGDEEGSVLKHKVSYSARNWTALAIDSTKDTLVAVTSAGTYFFDALDMTELAYHEESQAIVRADVAFASGKFYVASGSLFVFGESGILIENQPLVADCRTPYRLVEAGETWVAVTCGRRILIFGAQDNKHLELVHTERVSDDDVTCLTSKGDVIFFCTETIPRGMPRQNFVFSYDVSDLSNIVKRPEFELSELRPSSGVFFEDRLILSIQGSVFEIEDLDSEDTRMSEARSAAHFVDRLDVDKNRLVMMGDRKVSFAEARGTRIEYGGISITTPDRVLGIGVVNDKVYVANDEHGISVYSKSNPTLYLPIISPR